MDDSEDVDLQRALELSLQEQAASGAAIANDEDNRKRRHDDIEEPRQRASKSQAQELASIGPSHAAERGAGSSSATAATTSEVALRQALEQSLQQSRVPGSEQAGPSTSASGSEPDAAAMAAQLQGLLSQMGSISCDNPFSGLFTGAQPQARPDTRATNSPTSAPSQQVQGQVSPREGQRESKLSPKPEAGLQDWAERAERWASSLPAATEEASTSDLAIPESQEVELAAALSQILQMPVSLRGLKSASRAQSGTLTVHLSSAPGVGGLCMSNKAIEMALKTRLSSINLKGKLVIRMLAECHTLATSALQAKQFSPLAASAAARWQHAMARHAFVQLQKEDEEDLYFTNGGQQTSNFLQGLAAGAISEHFLVALLQAHQGRRDEAAEGWEKILRVAFSALKKAKFTEGQAIADSLTALDLLLRQPPLQHALAAILIREARTIQQVKPASAFEQRSILAPLLSLSPIPSCIAALSRELMVDSPAAAVFTELRSYGRPGEERLPHQSIRQILWRLYSAAHEICARMARQKLIQPPGAGREALLSWLAAAVNLSESRAAAGEGKGVIQRSQLVDGVGDGFALGLTALCLKFSQWLQKESLWKHLGLLQPSYYRQNPFRWHFHGRQTALTGERIDGHPPPASSLTPGREQAAPHFAAECFFLTQLSMHYCLLPAVNRSAETLQVALHGWNIDPKDPELTKRAQLYQDCTSAQLLDPGFAGEVVKFVFLEAAWLNSLMQQDDATALDAFSSIPDFVVKDLASWLVYVIRCGQAELLGGLPIGTLMDAVTGMLLRQDLVGSAVVQSHLVELLQMMLAPQMDVRRQRGGRSLGPTALRPGEAQLVAAMYGTGATQTRLVPGLMKAFVAADHVVGLDVDRDRFDKFVFRDKISSLLAELWKDQSCLASLTKLAREAASTPEAEVFSDFVGALMNSLIYLLEDSLMRLTDIHNIEEAKRDEAAWQAASSEERDRKEKFYTGQQRTTSGFMRLAWRSMGMLKTMAADPVIRAAFWEQPLVKRFAYAVVKFTNKLAGPECQQLEVEEPDKYLFYPAKLLTDTAELMARLSESSAFVAEVAQDADYDAATMKKAHEALAKDQKVDYEIVARLEKIITQVSKMNAEPDKGASPQNEDLGFCEDEPLDLEELYKATLGPLQIGTFDANQPRAYNREFNRLAETRAGNTQKQMKRLAKEMRDLPKVGLTLELSGAIFVRHDEDRLDKVRVMLIGPDDTPYAGGCFHFDLFFPPDYPHVPPLMMLETTGLGRARFHPNLYADGKVCLSLLGTFHGSDASEKWDPSTSSLYQILMSVLGLIFVPDPYFAEPNAEIVKGTREGGIADRNYNAGVAVNTVRYAMIDQLRNPRPGFEDVTSQHFRLQRNRIMAFCRHWADHCQGLQEQQIGSLQKSIRELHQLLSELS